MENYREADLYELSELAGDGDYAAAMELARRFREGDGVEPDQDRAESWLRYAMSLRDGGDESAPEPQPQGAASAAETPDNKAGHGWTPTAQLKGLTIGQLREEATRGNPFAMSLQGQKYLASRSAEEKKLGLSTLEKAIDIGKRNLSGGDSELVQMMLRDYLAMGRCYEELARSTGDDSCNAKAFECYGNAQELDPNEVTDLLRCYEEGIGCRPDRKEILRLREKLAETGGILPRFQLAEAYYENEQHMRASEWYQIALESGDAQAHPAAADICRIRLRELDADGQTDALSAAMDKDALWAKTVNGDALAAWFYAKDLAATDDERETALRYGQNGTGEPYAGMCRAALEEADRQRLAAEQAERRRLFEEAERRRLAAEEAERKRLAEVEAEQQRLMEEAERQRQAAAEAMRQRLAAEEAERQRLAAEEAEAERQRQAAEETERQRKAEAERQRENEQKKKKDRFRKLVAAAALLLLVLIYAAVSNHNAPANTAFRDYSAGHLTKAANIFSSRVVGNSKQEDKLSAKVEKKLREIAGKYEKGSMDAATLNQKLEELLLIAPEEATWEIFAYRTMAENYEQAQAAYAQGDYAAVLDLLYQLDADSGNQKRIDALMKDAQKQYKAEILAETALGENEPDIGAYQRAIGTVELAIGYMPNDRDLLARRDALSKLYDKRYAEQILAQTVVSESETNLSVYEQAIAAVNQGLGYLPENKELRARRDELNARYEARYCAEVLSRTDVNAAEPDPTVYRQAMAAVSQALTLFPNNQELLARMGVLSELYVNRLVADTSVEARDLSEVAGMIAALDEAMRAVPGSDKLAAQRERLVGSYVTLVTDAVKELKLAREYAAASTLADQARTTLPENAALQALYADVQPTRLADLQVVERDSDFLQTDKAIKDSYGNSHGPDNCFWKDYNLGSAWEVVLLDKSYSYLTGEIAVADTTGTEYTGVITISDGNGNVLYDSGKIGKQDRPISIGLDVTNVDLLKIMLTDRADTVIDDFNFYK